MIDPLLIPARDGFRALGVGNTTGYRLVKAGKLRLVKIGNKSLLEVSAVKALADAMVAEANAKAARFSNTEAA